MTEFCRTTAIATAAAVGLSAFAALAAAPLAGDPTATPPAKTQPSQGHMKVEGIEQRVADLHAKLKITPEQQPQWDQFAQVMRDNARDMEGTFKARIKAMPSMTATQNMKSYAELAASHAQNVEKLVPVFQALYDTMSADQKRAADEIFRDDANHPHHGGHRREMSG
jgi:periplasmic protein CpxP/Spy